MHNKRMDSASVTSFSSLPVEVCLDILERLDWASALNARLVCAKWYHFINHVKPAKFKVTDKANPYKHSSPDQRPGVVLPCLTESHYGKIGVLKVRDLDTPLPILSSTRVRIPFAKKLILSEGNSTDNVLKLIRYYAHRCEMLELESFCFSGIKQTQLHRGSRLDQLTELSILFDLMPRFTFHTMNHVIMDTEMKLKQHITTLGAFLASVRLPNLRAFALRLIPRNPRQPISGSLVAPLSTLSAGMESFMKVHGPQLTELATCMPCLSIMDHFKYADKIKKLSLSYYVDYTGEYANNYGTGNDPREAISCFKGLVHLSLRPSALSHGWFRLEHENSFHGVTALLLANNKDTLRTLSYGGGQTGDLTHSFHDLKWLNSAPDLQLKELKILSLEFDPANYALSPRLPHVTKFVLLLRFMNGPQEDWSSPLFHWIIRAMPTLRSLVVYTLHKPTPVGIALRTLVEGCPALRQIKLQSSGIPVNEDATAWIAETGGHVEGKLVQADSSSTYEILIHHHLPATATTTQP